MLAFAAEITSGAWLGLIALAAVCTRSWRPRPSQARATWADIRGGPAPHGEPGPRHDPAPHGAPPAVVSLLAGRLDHDGYPATLLDLAARGWFSMTEVEPGRVACRMPARDPTRDPARDPAQLPGADSGLAAYERRALAHLALRARGMDNVPGAALGSGFELGDREFRELFGSEVRADASQRQLIRRRISRGTLALLMAAGLPAAALTFSALARHGGASQVIFGGFGYLLIMRLLWVIYQGTRLTAAGRAALAGWLGFRAAMTGSRSRPTAGTALLAAGGDRRIAYAAALGAAPAAVAAFGPDGDWLWSSFDGSWRRVTVGKPHEPYVPSPGLQVGIKILCSLYACMTLVVLEEFGWTWAAVFTLFPGYLLWGAAWAVFRCAARARRLPPLAEFNGQILKRWTENIPGDENSSEQTMCCIAIDDGTRDEAWTLMISDRVYAGILAGSVVHVRIDPRRNRLLAMCPAQA
jgi:Predicted membrane protein (DUF2207)